MANPIFSRNPAKAIAVARALRALQGPENPPEERLRTFLGLASAPAADVLGVRWARPSPDADPVVVGVDVAVRMRVGPVHVSIYVDVRRDVQKGGIAAVGPRDVGRLYTSWGAAVFIAPHPHLSRKPWHVCRCPRLYAALHGTPIAHFTWLAVHGAPDPRYNKWVGYGRYGLALLSGVKPHLAVTCPDLVKRARHMARQAAWQTAREAREEGR